MFTTEHIHCHLQCCLLHFHSMKDLSSMRHQLSWSLWTHVHVCLFSQAEPLAVPQHYDVAVVHWLSHCTPLCYWSLCRVSVTLLFAALCPFFTCVVTTHNLLFAVMCAKLLTHVHVELCMSCWVFSQESYSYWDVCIHIIIAVRSQYVTYIPRHPSIAYPTVVTGTCSDSWLMQCTITLVVECVLTTTYLYMHKNSWR